MKRSGIIAAVLLPAILTLLLLGMIFGYARGVFVSEASRGPLDRQLLWDTVRIRRSCETGIEEMSALRCGPLEISILDTLLVIPATY